MKYTIFTRKNNYPFFLNVLDKGYILEQNKKDILENLLKTNLSIEQIIEITGFTAEEIEKLKKQ